mmetsp:Transcript_17050/g.22084  ORF Transcript_17050/g.22084 Transcript_17050/m.22084 type:complete len:221 (-) Transcript_17050:258-920(-)
MVSYCSFGKHRGKHFTQVPWDYIKWARKEVYAKGAIGPLRGFVLTYDQWYQNEYEPILTFGQYKGKLVRDIDGSYYRWCKEQEDPSPGMLRFIDDYRMYRRRHGDELEENDDAPNEDHAVEEEEEEDDDDFPNINRGKKRRSSSPASSLSISNRSSCSSAKLRRLRTIDSAIERLLRAAEYEEAKENDEDEDEASLDLSRFFPTAAAEDLQNNDDGPDDA